MKRIAITPIDEFDLARGNVVSFEASNPARVVHARVRYAEKKRLIARPRNKALDADDLTTLVTLFVEMESGAPLVSRRVVAIPVRTMAEVSDVARFVDIIEDEHGKQLALYELPPAWVDQGERDEEARIAAARDVKRPNAVLSDDRCAVCGWPLQPTPDQGCTRGNCSQRPPPEKPYDLARALREHHQSVHVDLLARWHSAHAWRAPDAALGEALEEHGVCVNCGLYASEAEKPCAAPAPEADGCVSPRALSGVNDGGGAA
jgi:hypothetical protein